MKPKPQPIEPALARHVAFSGKRWFTLRGDWSVPPVGPYPRLRRLMLYSMHGCRTTALDFLRLFPSIEELDVSDGVVDFAGLEHLRRLRILNIGWWNEPKYIRVDLSRFPKLRSLDARWSKHLTGLGTLRELTDLHLRYVYGEERLDFSSLSNLRHLSIGPAKGVKTVALDGLRRLGKLELAVMPRLTEVSGAEFHHTVTELRIAGSHALPREFLAGFTKLKMVTIGTKSTLTAADFPRCRPKVFKSPI